MSSIWLTVLGVTGLLAFAVLMLPAAKRLNFPYTVLLAAVGILLGVLEALVGDNDLLVPVSDFLTALRNFNITADAVFFIFLPALVFEAALSIDVRRLMDDIAPILMLAVLGLLLSTFLIGYAIQWSTAMPILICLLIGAICSATDPVAVVALFKEVGAPKRLTILVEGESLFNDATAIVLFSLLAAMITEGESVGIVSGVLTFLKVFFGGVLLGYFFGRVLCWLMQLFAKLVLVNITLSISCAYLSFIVAEHYFHVSGVMAVVTAALVSGSIGRTILAPKLWQELEDSWEQTGFWANSIIFVLVGMAVPKLLTNISMTAIVGLITVIVSAFVGRAIITYVLMPTMTKAGMGKTVSTAYKTVMFWGGLRGAVSLALALAIIENPAVAPEHQDFIAVLVTGFVLFTLFVNATTIRFVMGIFELNKLSPIECILRDRAVGLSLEKVSDKMEYSATQLSAHKDLTNDLIQNYQQKSRALKKMESSENSVAVEDWIRMGLSILGAQERRYYAARFTEGIVPSHIFRLLTAQLDDLLDALKDNSVTGYQLQIERNLAFDWRFKMAEFTNRNLSVQTFLSQRLAERLNILVVKRGALESIKDEHLAKLRPYIDEQAYDEVTAIFNFRYQKTEQALTAISGQYPEYAGQLFKRQLSQSAFWQEEKEYQNLLSDGLITHDVYRSLTAEIQQKSVDLNSLPTLDLQLNPEELIKKVPMLVHCSDEQIKQLTKLLKPMLAFPGKQIIRKGDSGDNMYFIANGAVNVQLENQNKTLVTGNFFGEIAILKKLPRVADVEALGYCSLLALNHRDFQAFLKQNQDLKQQIEKAGEERLNALSQSPQIGMPT